jgi:hypothetical protein
MVLISADISKDMGIFWREIVYNNKSRVPIVRPFKNIFKRNPGIWSIIYPQGIYEKSPGEGGTWSFLRKSF